MQAVMGRGSPFINGNDYMMRCDNETGKDNHKHIGEVETDYPFNGISQLATGIASSELPETPPRNGF